LDIVAEMGHDRMGEEDNEVYSMDEDDDDDGGDAVVAPPAIAATATAPSVAAPPPKADTEEDEDPEMMIAKQEAPEALAVILPNEEPEPPQPYLFTMLMRDHEESQSRVYDDLDDSTIAEYDVDEWFPKVGSHD
jgi:hypothetical protein